MRIVLISQDGGRRTVEVVDSVARHGIYLEPVCRPMSVRVPLEPSFVRFDVVEWHRKGSLFDGVPVFLSGGRDLKEARCQLVVMDRQAERDGAMAECRRLAFKLFDDHYADWHLEDESLSILEQTAEHRAAHIVTVECRVLGQVEDD